MTPLQLVIVPKTIKATIKRKNYHKLKIRQPLKMVKHTQTICRKFADKLF